MKITGIIYICFGIPVIITIALTSLVILYSSRANRAAEIRQIAVGLNSAVSELDLVTHEYLLYKEERMEQQWQSRYDSTQLLLQRAAVGNIEETELMPPAFANLNRLFLRLVENSEQMERLIRDGASEEAIAAAVLLEEGLANDLGLQAETLSNDTSVLAETASNNSNQAQTITRNLAIVLMVAIAAIAVIAALIITRMITVPLARLDKYAKNIGEGKYDAHITNNHSNEIGTVASTVKSMVERLLTAQHDLVLSEKMAAIGQLASGVAHDLRNPLTVINNAAHFLKLKLAGADDQVHSYLDMMKKAVLKSSNVIEELLDLARTKEPVLKDVDISLLTAEVISSVNIPENVELVVDKDDDLQTVAADVNQIERVFSNLVNNAVQAMPDGGTLTISSHQNKKIVVTEFRDTGKGIARENLKKVFEPLFTTKANAGGTGIGLAVSKTIVEAHRGSIKVKSEKGKGTIFTVKLPNYREEHN